MMIFMLIVCVATAIGYVLYQAEYGDRDEPLAKLMATIIGLMVQALLVFVWFMDFTSWIGSIRDVARVLANVLAIVIPFLPLPVGLGLGAGFMLAARFVAKNPSLRPAAAFHMLKARRHE